MAIQKDSSKLTVQGGGVHPLTSYVMNYLVFLGDYSESLADILADWPLELHGSSPEPLSNQVSDVSEECGGTPSAITTRLAWLILVLLCKLDTKAQLYEDVALSYLFLANNHQYIVAKVSNTTLRHVTGGEWITNHESKARGCAIKYERIGWAKVLSSLQERRKAGIVEFNAAFKETFLRQASWVAPNQKLREEIRASLAGKLLPANRRMHEARSPGADRVCP
ncbi:hypothetical protein MLD38_040136 [Melastoma candidum]|nr:hypothetical protein MLD38_040136 [Melastoma candidum]